jgi:hypothetical protein
MKKAIVTLACCALIAPLAFAQHQKQTATTTERVTVTGTVVKMTTEEGAAASYQPAKTLVVREDGSNNPGSYVLKGPGHVVNKAGEVIKAAIKPGARVRVYYANMGGSRVVDHVVVLDWVCAAGDIERAGRLTSIAPSSLVYFGAGEAASFGSADASETAMVPDSQHGFWLDADAISFWH